MLLQLSRFALAVALAAGVAAAEQKTISGYLLDKACSADALKKGEKAAREHGKDCALMDDCMKSGFGVFTADGKFIAFDADGNKRAVSALRAAKKDTGIQVTVTGDASGDTIKVATLKLQ